MSLRILSLTLLLWLPLLVRGEFHVGVAVEKITPDPLLPISGGMGPSAPAKEKQGELSVRAMVLVQGETRVAFVSVDALGFPAVLGDRVREKVKGIPGSNILISASHTHSAPDCYAFPDGNGGHTGSLDYMSMVCERMAKVINAANASLLPARLKVGTGEVQGKVAYNYYAPDLYDRRGSVIQAIGEDEKPIVTLVNYAVHPEVLGANGGICSPDLVGPLREYIESNAGGVAMFINGAQGGMVTADNRDLDKPSDPVRGYWHDSRTWEECLRIGATLGKESLRIVADAPIQDDPALRCFTRPTRFPVDSEELWAVVQYSPLKYPHNIDDRTITSTINYVQLGNAQILTIPGEALPNIGFYLKRKMRGEHNLLFGLTNDAFGYILTKEDFDSFDRYQYVSRVSLGEQTGKILVENALELVEQAR